MIIRKEDAKRSQGGGFQDFFTGGGGQLELFQPGGQLDVWRNFTGGQDFNSQVERTYDDIPGTDEMYVTDKEQRVRTGVTKSNGITYTTTQSEMMWVKKKAKKPSFWPDS